MAQSRREFLKRLGVSAAAIPFLSQFEFGCAAPKEQPNIVWLVSEDNGRFLGCYGDEYADTPNLDRLAAEGVRYDNAYANAPVCAPMRSSIITGMYACSLGTQHMRSGQNIPSNVKFFPEYLRAQGYYCTNNHKEDYNTQKPDGAWDESSKEAHYRNRQPGQPFFAIFNHTRSHESSLHSKIEITHDPKKAPVPPYHPDVPEVRRDWAQYYDRMKQLDDEMGERLKMLEEDGVLDNTIVFYYSDHAGIVTRSKRFLYQSGTHIPVIVRFPEKYKHLAPAPAGTLLDRPISLIDMGPTVLSLAGIQKPDIMQGRPYLGHYTSDPPEYTYFFRGRMDERYDMARAIADKRYKLIRNYMPHKPWGQYIEYLWRMDTTQVWEKMYKAGELNEVQSAFWEPKDPVELFDIVEDPHNINNLANDPAHKATLERLDKALTDWMIEIKDLGFVPEGEVERLTGGTPPYTWSHIAGNYDVQAAIGWAETASAATPETLDTLIDMLHSKNSIERYWGVVGCLVLGEKAKGAMDDMLALLEDESGDVRVYTAEFVCRYGDPSKGLPVLEAALTGDEEYVSTRAAVVLDELGETARPLLGVMKQENEDTFNYTGRALKKAIADLEG